MDISKVDPLVLETWAAHEFFRRLGYSSDVIFVECYPSDVWVRVSTERVPGKFFRLRVGEMGDLTVEDFHKLWIEFIEPWNRHEVSFETMQPVWRKSKVMEVSVRILMEMSSLGFPVRA